MQSAIRSPNQPRASGGWRRRLLHHHVPLALASAMAILLWMSLPLFRPAGQQMHMPAQEADHVMPARAAHSTDHSGPARVAQAAERLHQVSMPAQAADHLQNRGFMGRFTTATGYVALGLLALTLLIGPINLLLRKRYPVSSYLRRDMGAWTAIISVVHVVAGLQVHGPPGPIDERILRYFFARDGSPLVDNFGLGNWTGLAATVIVVGLLAISNDFALRRLKAGPWKWLQRLNYALFALVIAHAIFYGALLRVTSPAAVLLGLSVTAVLVGQAVGVWLWRRRYSRAAARPA
jgi:sulfoxide reductase heme-binding subunit YedZ